MQIILLLLGIGALVVASFTVPTFLLWKRHPNPQDSASIFGWLIVQYALLATLVWWIQEIPLTLEQALAMATIPWLRRIINFFLPDQPWTWGLPKSERLRREQEEKRRTNEQWERDRQQEAERERRQGANQERQANYAVHDVLTRAQACRILGVQWPCDKQTIQKTFKRLMFRVHPDQGGSEFFAGQLNLARDTLLEHLP